MKIQKSNIVQLGNAIVARIITVKTINLIVILRVVPVACYVYHFNMQSLLTFEKNFKYKEIFPWLPILILKLERQPFHPNLNIECSFSGLDLTRDQLDFKDNKTFFQLEDCAFAVAVKNSKFAISVMFTTDLKFAADCLLNCFNKEFKSNSLELSNDVKRKYEIENPIDWSQDGCCICTFPLEINTTSYDGDAKAMSHVGFIISKEHKF